MTKPLAPMTAGAHGRGGNQPWACLLPRLRDVGYGHERGAPERPHTYSMWPGLFAHGPSRGGALPQSSSWLGAPLGGASAINAPASGALLGRHKRGRRRLPGDCLSGRPKHRHCPKWAEGACIHL